MDSDEQFATVEESSPLIITPMRNTLPLAIHPEETEITELARKQLENLSKTERKKKSLEVVPALVEVREAVVDSNKHILSSSIISKSELDDEIRKKVAKQETTKKVVSTIEIPQEIILSELETTPAAKAISAVQLHDQELIDILEGKSNEEMYEVVTEDGQSVLVKDLNEIPGVTSSYEIVTADSSVSTAKAKLLEREIAMRQIASLPVRKHKKPYALAPPKPTSSNQTVAEALAADWCDDEKEDEMILEVVNVPGDTGEPQIKILNMTILNEAGEVKPKTLPAKVEPKVLPTKIEPKILNKQAPKPTPKILNINASSAEPASFKRSRVIKKKEIWDPSEEKKVLPTLPPSITIKKLTKESIVKPPVVEAVPEVAAGPKPPVTVGPKPTVKKAKKRSEIDKLLQDEGAVNMIYSLERDNKNEDVPEIEVKPDQKLLIDKSEEKSTLVTKAKAIKNVVMKQSSSPPEVKPVGRARKRDATPVKSEEVPKPPKAAAVGRKKKASDNSWDYIYSQAQATCDDAMIIRRRSNSSYSSSAASPRRLSVDVNESFESPPQSAKKLGKDNFEFTKPPSKNTKSPADKVLKKDFVDELRGKISTVITKNKETKVAAPKGRKRAAAPATDSSAPAAKRASERRSNGSDHKEYRLVKEGKVANIILAQNPLSISLLGEMKSVLNQLETDESEVVVITSSEGFSEGLDYSTLVQTTVDKRKQAASDLVTALKNFLISLAAFPKTLVCGLQGHTSGIAVSMLPLFDLVFADSSATFSLPNAKIGSNVEGISILRFSGKVNFNAVNQMFCLDESLNASSAQSSGLITKVIDGDFNKGLMDYCTKIAGFSSQTLESTKSIMNEDFLSTIEAHLAKEVKILQQQWITAECQDKFKKHAAKGECSPEDFDDESGKNENTLKE